MYFDDIKRFGAIKGTNIVASPANIKAYNEHLSLKSVQQSEEYQTKNEKKPFNWLFFSFFGAGILLLILFTYKK